MTKPVRHAAALLTLALACGLAGCTTGGSAVRGAGGPADVTAGSSSAIPSTATPGAVSTTVPSSGATHPSSLLPPSSRTAGRPTSTGKPATPLPSSTSTTTAGTTTAGTTTAGTATAGKVTATTQPKATATAWVIGKATVVPKTWTQQFLSPYGAAADRLGSAPGGDGGSLTLGPEYAAQGPDGTWYVLDAAKRRVVHLDSAGGFLGAVAVPASLLADGYFSYQLPRVLADGMLVAESQVGETSRLLRVRGTSISGVPTSTAVIIAADDGKALYGFDRDNHPVSVNPSTGAVKPAPWFRTQAGNRYRVTPAAGKITVELPDSLGRTTVVMPVTASGMGGTVHPSVELAGGANGDLHLLVLGISESDESVQLAGYATVTANGIAGPMEQMRDPTSPADPGSPAHLGIRPGSTQPFLVFVDPAGLRTYLRSGS